MLKIILFCFSEQTTVHRPQTKDMHTQKKYIESMLKILDTLSDRRRLTKRNTAHVNRRTDTRETERVRHREKEASCTTELDRK